ncbi:30S ribosomal protein S14 [Candidatus Woesearchaeota archaeon]|nr:MAG: 30S ribosomal protein S14 [Candidatus Woesearchaeota archaeon]
MLKQLSGKPGKLVKFKKHNAPKERKTGRNVKECRRCGRKGGHIQKYGLQLCRQCFRQHAEDIGFKQYS